MKKKIIVGVTGASGAIYAERLVEVLCQHVERVYLVITDAGQQVCQHELTRKKSMFSLLNAVKSSNIAKTRSVEGDDSIGGGLASKGQPSIPTNLRVFRNDDLFAPIASGSAAATHMVILPCSMGTMGRIANGLSSNLLERSADVMLKQSRQLIICPRETPFNRIHVNNMGALMDAGAQIAPAMPAFYDKPSTVDDLVNFMVGRVIDLLSIENELFKRWNSRMI